MTKLLEKAVEEISKLPDKEQNEIAQLIFDELNDENLYEFVCPKGHRSLTQLQEQKFEILFDIASLALIDGYTKEAVSSYSSSLERFIGILIEHTAGAFPLWLSPVQVKVIPVRTNHNEYAKGVFEMLKENNIRAEFDDAEENLGKKVRDAKNNKITYWIVIGDKEIEAEKITLESRDAGQLGQMSKEELVVKLLEEIKNKK